MNNKPVIFVGSSEESSDIMDKLKILIGEEVIVNRWKSAGFELSKTFMENIDKELSKSDFGIFIFGEDDSVIFRDEEKKVTRDNVIFELGLFSGKLGRERTLIVAPDSYGNELKIPSDLLGVTVSIYKDSNPEELKSSLDTVALNIKEHVRKIGLRDKGGEKRRVDSVLERGSTEYINILADAALYLGDSRHEYSDELKRRLKNREIVPMKYLYRHEYASNHWIKICKKESYKFYKNSLSLLRKEAKNIVKLIRKEIDTKEIDFISLGSGDGKKDNILLKQFTKSLKKNSEYIYYYPVDISDTLISETAKNFLSQGIDKKLIKSKVLLADFNKLPELKRVYEERPHNNVFSILGNTIGNADENDIIKSIADSMYPGDIVIIEINIGEGSTKDPMLREKDYVLHDFAPLASFGIQFDENLIKHIKVDDASIIEGTSSILTVYEKAEIDGDEVNEIKLSIVHHYDLNNFIKEIESRMNVNVIDKISENDVALIIAKRNKDS